MKDYDVIVIGGGPAAIISAVTAKKNYPDKNVVLVRDIEKPLIPCGIPYIYGTLNDIDKNLLGDAALKSNGIDILIERAIKIDRESKKVVLSNNDALGYDKLVIATGSSPFSINIKGEDKKGVYYIKKDYSHLSSLKKDLEKAKNVIIIGGGFIGVEFADEIAKLKDKNITLVEILDKILICAFDKEFCDTAAEKLTEDGVKILTNKKVAEIIGDEKVKSIKLDSGEELPADVVIIGIGGKANSELAKDAGLLIGKHGAIWTDEYMRTTDLDIFAVGDCAEKKDFFTRRPSNVMLASTATAEARIAGMNLYQLRVLRSNYGTISIFSTSVGNIGFGAAGLTECNANKNGFDVISGKFEAVDRHPGAMPDASKVKVKLVFSKKSGILLGGQVSGGTSVGELINLIGFMVQYKVTATELLTLQIGTHPKLTSAPTIYPVIKAAEDALAKLN